MVHVSTSAAYSRLHEFGIEAEQIRCQAAPFPIWLVTVRGAPLAAAWTLLSAREQQRALRFATPQFRGRYVTAHAALRILIEAYFGIVANRQTFSTTDFGKPKLTGYPDVQCNLSYSGDRVLLGVAPGAEIGLDIERIRMISDATDLMEVYFTTREKSLFRAGSPDSLAFHRDFLTIWTRKEACLKAVGQGLNFYLDTLECTFEDTAAPVRIGRHQVRAGAIQISEYAASWARATPVGSIV